MRSTSLRYLCVLIGVTSFGFTPFGADPAREGNRLYKEGKYQEAIAKYGEALVDDPDSGLLNFNMGLAHYKAGNYADAVASLSRVPTGGDGKREAKVAYNIGNAQFQMATAKEIDKPKEALEGYAQALVTYRRAIGADPTAPDAKHNYEFVYNKMLDLKRRMEEQQKQQQDQQNQQDQQGQDEQKQDQQQDQQQQGNQDQPQDQQDQQDQQGQQDQPGEQKDEQGQDQQQQQADQQQGDQGQPPSEDQQQAGGGDAPPEQGGEQQQAVDGEQAGGKSEQTDAQKQAAAVIDMGADEELRPDEFTRKLQKAGVAEAAQDW